LLLSLLASAAARGAPRAPPGRTLTFDLEIGRKPTSPRLLVWEKGDLILKSSDGSALVPNRVYGVHNQEDNSWAYVLTTPAGKFPTPLELFVPGSVVVGSSMGAPSPTDRFQLSADYRWLKTDKYEMHYFWNPATPRLVKRVRFFTPPTFASKKK
jgi:hypothetical protein